MVRVLFLSLACAFRFRAVQVLVSFLARPKPKIPFLGLSQCSRNQTETLATQAILSWAQFHVNVAHNTMTMTTLL